MRINAKRMENRKLLVMEQFRFYDDLHPSVQKAVREAHYEWNPVEIMNEQHRFFGSNTPIEELADLVKERDEDRFNTRMKPKLSYVPTINTEDV